MLQFGMPETIKMSFLSYCFVLFLWGNRQKQKIGLGKVSVMLEVNLVQWVFIKYLCESRHCVRYLVKKTNEKLS